MNMLPIHRTRQLGKIHVPTVTLAHGGGGKAMKDLIDDVFVAAFDNAALAPLEDQARLDAEATALTDAEINRRRSELSQQLAEAETGLRALGDAWNARLLALELRRHDWTLAIFDRLSLSDDPEARLFVTGLQRTAK